MGNYSLQKYKGTATRHTCPKCGDRHSFVYYVDENNVPLNTLPENAIAFNVTQQGALSRGTETNSVNFQNQIKDFQVWVYFDKTATGNGVTPGGLYKNLPTFM